MLFCVTKAIKAFLEIEEWHQYEFAGICILHKDKVYAAGCNTAIALIPSVFAGVC